MLYFLILLVPVALGVFLILRNPYGGNADIFGAIFVLFGGLILLLSLLWWPVIYMEREAKLQHIEMVRQVAQEGRLEESYEAVSFRMKIAELNGWLAEQRYWNTTIFHLYVPDAVETTEPISAKTGGTDQ